MAFNYEKNKDSHGNDSFWTSYSDLFLGLSAIFLLLYVTASLRTGTDAMKAQAENQKLTQQVEELKSQLKMYESVKTDYLTSAPKEEVDEYQELMDKLTLLQEEAKGEKERLEQQANENSKKAVALNKYQQMVRNVMNANKVAKSRLLTRNDIIQEQDTEIAGQQKEISTLNKDISTKKQMIEQNEKQIADSQLALEKKIKELKVAYKSNKLTKKAFEQKTQALQAASDAKIRDLESNNQAYSQQLSQASQRLGQLSGELQNTQSALNQKTAEAQNLKGALAGAEGEAKNLKTQMASLQKSFSEGQARDRAAFEGELKKTKMDAAERGRREAQFRAEADKKEKAMQGQLSGLQGRLKDTEGLLARAQEEIDTRRAVAREIQKGFQKAGVKADIDMQTGEVVLDFGDSYFASDSADLLPQMTQVLEKAMPSYSASLLGNPKVASKISSVEIIGFASPTYKGRFIDPHSNKPEDKTALKYNMDLSYRRANSIFKHLVEDKGGSFQHKQDLIALMKVSGRSFLEVMKVQSRNPSNAAEFCKVNDCRKAQKVIVRFNMDSKK